MNAFKILNYIILPQHNVINIDLPLSSCNHFDNKIYKLDNVLKLTHMLIKIVIVMVQKITHYCTLNEYTVLLILDHCK